MKKFLFLILCLDYYLISISQYKTIDNNTDFVIATENVSLKEYFNWKKPAFRHGYNHIEEAGKDSMKKEKGPGRKMWRAIKVIFLEEIAVMGFFAAMPESFSNWNRNFLRNAPANWKKAFTMPPRWDKDPFFVNYILHPLGGAVYYNGVRCQGATQVQSLLFSFAESTFFEYFIESVAERPSIQDLMVTPIGGYLLGELQHRCTALMKRKGFTFAEKVLVFLINPMYVVFNGYR